MDMSLPWLTEEHHSDYHVTAFDAIEFLKHAGNLFNWKNPVYTEIFLKNGDIVQVCHAYLDDSVERFVPEKK
jgi:hypothetical protein